MSAIRDSRLARFVRMGRGSSALGGRGGETTGRSDDRQKDLLRPALERPLTWTIRWCGWPARSIVGFLDRRFASGLYAGSGPARSVDPAGGGIVHPEAHAQPVGRGAVRALVGEPVL